MNTCSVNSNSASPSLFNSYGVFNSLSMFDDFIDDFGKVLKSSRFSFEDSFPPLNLYVNTDDHACIYEIALTGYKKSWLNVEVDGSILTIEANPDSEEAQIADKKFLKRRIKANPFKKTYKIPEGYDVEKAEVTFEDGLLTIFIPIKEEKITSKKLLIQ